MGTWNSGHTERSGEPCLLQSQEDAPGGIREHSRLAWTEGFEPQEKAWPESSPPCSTAPAFMDTLDRRAHGPGDLCQVHNDSDRNDATTPLQKLCPGKKLNNCTRPGGRH